MHTDNKTILIVDDEALVRVSMRLFLQMLGYTVIESSNGAEALDIVRTTREVIAVALIDRRMPKMSGEETLSRMKQIRPELKSILTSGRDLTTTTCGPELGQADAILPKPHSPEEFCRVLRHVLNDDSNSSFEPVQQITAP